MFIGPEKLRDRGQITVRAPVRDTLGIGPGDRVLVAAVPFDPTTGSVIEGHRRLRRAVVDDRDDKGAKSDL